jgi:hypothetical protein
MNPTSGPPFVPYQPRPVSFLGVRTVRGHRLKTYGIVYGDTTLDTGRFEPGLVMLSEHLPEPAVAPGRPGVGFALLHQGRTADYLVLGWWDNENELPLRVAVRDAGGWRPAAGGESVCVWDLKVIWHEREAYVATVLSGRPGGSPEAYLSKTLEGTV